MRWLARISQTRSSRAAAKRPGSKAREGRTTEAYSKYVEEVRPSATQETGRFPAAQQRGFEKCGLAAATDLVRGLDRCLDRGWRGLAAAGLGLLAGWWVYVPAHELLHAAGCRAAGGEVTRLEIDPLYCGGLLARALPFVVAKSEYAGRLSGFDPHGSDLVRLATDLGPFVLTLFPGVWALRRAARARRPFLFGAALPFALAPFLSATGDAYEIGALLVTRLRPWAAPATAELLRGDDLGRKLAELAAAAGPAPWGGAVLAVLAGLAWAAATYGAGALVARALGQPALTVETPTSPRSAGGVREPRRPPAGGETRLGSP